MDFRGITNVEKLKRFYLLRGVHLGFFVLSAKPHKWEAGGTRWAKKKEAISKIEKLDRGIEVETNS